MVNADRHALQLTSKKNWTTTVLLENQQFAALKTLVRRYQAPNNA